MSSTQTVQPKITVLSRDQMERVHEYSLQVLLNTGVRVDSAQARQIFSQGGASVDGDRVRIPRELVEWALKAAPSTVDLFDRNGNHAFCLGDDRMRFGIGVTVLNYQDPQTDEPIKFAREHMVKTVRLGNTLPNYDVISTVGIIQDYPPEQADLYAALEMIANTTKPLVILVSEQRLFPVVLDLLEELGGDLTSKPYVIPYFNPITPLILDSGTVSKMLTAINRGLPIIYSNYSMSGMTSPITPAGNLAMLNAELLVGLVFSQLIKEGTPIILGSLPNQFDMKKMISFYDPQSILSSLACAEMLAYYQLPHCGTSGGANGWGPDLQAADILWMNALTSIIGKSGLAPFVGDTLGAKAFSPVSVVYAHEIITQSLRFAAGFELDDASVALDEIDQVGPGGNFLITEQTLKNYRTAYYNSPMFPNMSMESWVAKGRPDASKLLRNYTEKLLDQPVVPDDHDDLLAKGEAFIRRFASG